MLRTLIKAQVGQEEARARVICPSLWKRKKVPSVQIKHLYKKRERGSEGTALKPPAPHLSSLPWKLTSGQRQTVISRMVLIPGPALHPDS